MSLGLVGRKVGMTRIFTDDGDSQSVTVLDVSDNRVTQIKKAETDGYSAVQVAFGKRRASRVTKALAGHLAKAGVEAGHTLPKVRDLPVQSSAIISRPTAPPTVTRVRTILRVLSDRRRIRAGFFPARKWRAIWVM